jgi:hypothetical protein
MDVCKLQLQSHIEWVVCMIAIICWHGLEYHHQPILLSTVAGIEGNGAKQHVFAGKPAFPVLQSKSTFLQCTHDLQHVLQTDS